ncbi:hypothetical protein PVAP13_5NG476400 [Panicum virgatum]|uniref:Uncharacterized protein n=1 Tax=Panicum virgatum TaxID=38727 RepID=A0A8T0S3K9_PANVG|nr:hypothetical protein PVAP13_5NG476400 [Panicum virgatum]
MASRLSSPTRRPWRYRVDSDAAIDMFFVQYSSQLLICNFVSGGRVTSGHTHPACRPPAERSEVVSAFRSEGRWAPHTTRSWQFLGFEEGVKGPDGGSDWLPSLDKSSSDVIVGVLDSGIWPESRSFSDEGLGPVPARWKGACQGGESFTSSSCNRKIIGARYYLKAYEAHYNGLNTTYAFRSPRDNDGHGTHTASTVAGRTVPDVSALGGFAAGAASGGAPLARLAVYKVCWPIPGRPNPNIENTCFEADMLAAMDDAVGDGVDVLSVSIGSTGAPMRFADDGIAVGALHAARRGVVVSCSGGNSGPTPATVSNLAPWMLTVGASSIDRAFDSPIKLGNGVAIMGQTVTPYQLPGNKPYPLVYAADAVVPGTPANVSNQCLPNSLSADKVRGKIVVCLRGTGLRVEKGLEVKRAGGAAILLGNRPASGSEVPVDSHVLPGTAVSAADATTILAYINSSSSPTAVLGPSTTVVDVRPSPVMAQFSSRGPNVLEPNILKPDITAPGLNILAAWSEASSPTKLDGDHRVVQYNIVSGTSMSCPHVSAAAVLLKAAHPDWSSAAIRSAIMTTGKRLGPHLKFSDPNRKLVCSVLGSNDHQRQRRPTKERGRHGSGAHGLRVGPHPAQARAGPGPRVRRVVRGLPAVRVRERRVPAGPLRPVPGAPAAAVPAEPPLGGRARPQRLGDRAPDGDARRLRRGTVHRRRGRARGRLRGGRAEAAPLRAGRREEGVQDKGGGGGGERARGERAVRGGIVRVERRRPRREEPPRCPRRVIAVPRAARTQHRWIFSIILRALLQLCCGMTIILKVSEKR